MVKLSTILLNIITITKTINEIVNGKGTILVLDVEVELVVLLVVPLVDCNTQILELLVYPVGHAVKQSVALKLI
jgi:hypothetical protein